MDVAGLSLFDERLAAGRGGVADGAGFYEYDDPDGETQRRDEGLAALRRALGIEHAVRNRYDK